MAALGIETPMGAGNGKPSLFVPFQKISPSDHLCLIYETLPEILLTVIPFIREGLAQSECCLYLADDNTPAMILDALRAASLNPEAEIASGRLRVAATEELFGEANRFDTDYMLQKLEEMEGRCLENGFKALRFAWEMSWVLRENPPFYKLIEHEANLTHAMKDKACAGICMYNKARFSPDVLLEIIRTHPFVAYRGRVCRNVYYVPPEGPACPPNPAREVDLLLQNIMEWELADRGLRESEERYRRLLASVTSYTYTVEMRDGKAASTGHGPGCLTVTGYSPEDYAQMPYLWFSMIYDEDRELVLRHLDKVQHGEKTPPLEHRIRHRDKSLRWIRNSFYPHLDSQDRLIRYEGVVEDITERKRAEKAQVQASRMEATATLAGGIAHDFNNLMMSVMGNAELLKSQLRDNAEAQEMLGDISRIAARAGELAHQMLAFAQGGKYQNRRLNLNEIIHQTLHHRKLAVSNVRFELHQEPALRLVEGDPTQIGQVLLNLLLNAVEAMEDRGGTIAIRTENIEVDQGRPDRFPDLKPGSHVSMSVKDTGCGMSAEVLARAFEPFFTTKFQGRGLGLAAAYGIVKNHGGNISVQSAVGAGSTFTVCLPAKEAQEEPLPSMPLDIPTGTETVLVVDDDPIVLSVTEKVLSHLGYRVLTCPASEEAIKLVSSFSDDIPVALLDMFMPQMTGTELLPHLKAARPGIKVILCSGYVWDETMRDLERSGVDAFLEKPVQMDILGRTIRRVLDKK